MTRIHCDAFICDFCKDGACTKNEIRVVWHETVHGTRLECEGFCANEFHKKLDDALLYGIRSEEKMKGETNEKKI